MTPLPCARRKITGLHHLATLPRVMVEWYYQPIDRRTPPCAAATSTPTPPSPSSTSAGSSPGRTSSGTDPDTAPDPPRGPYGAAQRRGIASIPHHDRSAQTLAYAPGGAQRVRSVDVDVGEGQQIGVDIEVERQIGVSIFGNGDHVVIASDSSNESDSSIVGIVVGKRGH